MSKWDLEFISRKDLKEHIKNTIITYNETLKCIDLTRFNKNIIDPIKLTFDSKVYRKSIEEVIANEIYRQRDKTNTNAIGYFHQNLFKYIKTCEVPEQGFDIIYTREDKSKVFVEMKNKHNTMNSSSSQRTYMKMQSKILENNKYECYLVEVIAKQSQHKIWNVSLDSQHMSNERIKRVSIDKFYEEVTGDKNAFYKICEALPVLIDEIIKEDDKMAVEKDSVFTELMAINPDLLKSLYILAFNSYEGFVGER